VNDAIGKGKNKGRINGEDQGFSNVEEAGRRRGYRVKNREQAEAKGVLSEVRVRDRSHVQWRI